MTLKINTVEPGVVMPKPCHVSLLDSGIQVLRSHASAAKVKHVDGVA